MKNTFRFLFICLLAISTLKAEEGKGIQFESTSWNEILAKASKEQKLIFLDAYADWCGPCKWMSKNVFTNDTVAQFFNENFINAKIDMEKGEGVQIAQKYGVRAYPTFLYINGNGELVHRTCGSCPPQDFLGLAKDALNPEKQLVNIKKNFEADPGNVAIAKNYFALLENACMRANDDVAKYFATLKEDDLILQENWDMVQLYLNDSDSREFKYLIKNRKKFAEKYSDEKVDLKINTVYENSLRDLIRLNNLKSYESLKAKIKKSGIPTGEKIILGSDLNLYKKKKEWKNYIKTAEKFVNKYGKNDYQLLNSISWTVFENFKDKPTLLKAEKWAKLSVDLKDEYANNDTYANILFKLGKNQQAKAAAEKSIELAKKEGSDYKDTQDLLNRILIEK